MMRTTRRPRPLRLAILLLAMAVAAGACSGTGSSTITEGRPDVLRFGVTPADDSAGQEERFGAMVEALREDVGIDVEFITTGGSYGGLIEALIAGRLDLAVMSPFAYVIATGEDADIEARAAYISSPDGQPTYRSVGMTLAANTEITELADFAGRRVCFVDPSSASGTLIPTAGLLAIDIDPATDLEEQIFAGSHPNSILSIADGSCDAGFAVESQLPAMIASDQVPEITEGLLKVVWESDPIPGVVLAVQRSLPEDLRDEIVDVFVSNTGADLYERGFCSDDWVQQDGPTGTPWCPIAGTNTWGFVEVDDALYDSLREVCVLTEAPACTG